MLVQLIIVLVAIIIGARRGGIGLGVTGGGAGGADVCVWPAADHAAD
jgi:anaerobic C4-dicarboxylate transporter